MIKYSARFLLPSIAEVIFLGIFFTLALGQGRQLLADGDTGYHIRTGEYILEHWTVPKHDIFSFWNPPLKWVAHEWLSEVIMAIVHRASGLTGLVIFFSLILSLTYVLLFKTARRISNNILLCLAITCFAAISSGVHWLARPHIFSLALAVIWSRLLYDYQYRGRNRLHFLPPLMLLWVNLHGGYILGIVLLIVYLAGNLATSVTQPPVWSGKPFGKSRTLAITLASCVLVTLINPQGYEILIFPFRLTSDAFLMDNVKEFLSPNFHTTLAFMSFLLFTLGVLAVSRVTLDWVELGLLLMLTYISLYSARYIPLFAVLTAPILVRLVDRMTKEFPPRVQAFIDRRTKVIGAIDRATKGYYWSLAGVCGVVFLASQGFIQFGFSDKSHPVAAVGFLKREELSGHMFNNDEFGDYVIYAAWPQYRVYMDGRSDMYGSEKGTEYLRVANGLPGWEEILQRHDVAWVFFNTISPLSAVLQARADWQLIFSDEVASIFVRKKDLQNRFLLEKYSGVVLRQK